MHTQIIDLNSQHTMEGTNAGDYKRAHSTQNLQGHERCPSLI